MEFTAKKKMEKNTSNINDIHYVFCFWNTQIWQFDESPWFWSNTVFASVLSSCTSVTLVVGLECRNCGVFRNDKKWKEMHQIPTTFIMSLKHSIMTIWWKSMIFWSNTVFSSVLSSRTNVTSVVGLKCYNYGDQEVQGLCWHECSG